MSLTLSSTDLEALSRVGQLLVSPLDHPDVDDWRSAVNRSLRELLGADSAGFLLPVPAVPDGLAMYSEEHDPEELARYPDVPPPSLSDGTPIEVRMLQLGVARLEEGYGKDYPLYLKSVYYNEFAGANGAHDTLAAIVPVAGADLRSVASLQLWHARPDGRQFGDREVKLLRLLFPSFRAGVESHLRWSAHQERLLHVFDGLGQAAIVCDRSGRLLHSTPALEAVLAADPEAAVLQAEMHAIAAELCGPIVGKKTYPGTPPQRLTREVDTQTARYRLCGCLHRGPSANGAMLALVALETLTSTLPSASALREHFGLTGRQAEVSLLLAQRLSTREIAERLSISPHTVLRHTEAIKEKLDIHDRRLITDRLRELTIVA